MGRLIGLGIVVLLAVLPLGVRIRYDCDGIAVTVLAGPVRILVFPRPKKEKKKKEKPKPEKKKTAPSEKEPPKLSSSQLETLTIIAYYQPATKAMVEQIRGVDSAYSVAALLNKKLIEEAGRLNVPGRPIQYRTTPDFLRTFGLSALEELPPIEKVSFGEPPAGDKVPAAEETSAPEEA